MCGIFGWISPEGLEAKFLSQACNKIRHRGPDDEGYLLFNGQNANSYIGQDSPKELRDSEFLPDHSKAFLALGHRRLSIVDLSIGGHQPMWECSGRYAIVFNGQIYNHIELRRELELQGYVFQSNSDTEVILHAWKNWGTDCLSKFNGMFAFLLFDNIERKLFAVRDRFGIKPLYLWKSPLGNLFFSSEIKAFTVMPEWKAVMNRQRIYDVLNWRILDHTNETCFQGVEQLPPGTFGVFNACGKSLELPRDGQNLYHWYYLNQAKCNLSFAEAAEWYREHFIDSVKLRLRSDVQVGSCLSGGLDSSSIVCIASEEFNQKGSVSQYTYTSSSDDPGVDESEWARKVAEFAGTKARYVYPDSEQIISQLEKIVYHHDEPFDSHGVYAYWEMMGAIHKDGLKVVLNGQGADEQLAGYRPFIGARIGRLIRKGKFLKAFQEIGDFSNSQGVSSKELWMRAMENALPQSISQAARNFSGYPGANSDWLNIKELDIDPVDPFLALNARNTDVESMCRAQLHGGNLQMLLHYEDRLSMAHSVEVRVPFLDFRLVDFTVGLPEHYKISNGELKRILRESMRGILPEQVRNRQDKKGFPTSIQNWMTEANRDKYLNLLEEAVHSNRDVFNDNTFNLVRDILSGKKAFNLIPWRILIFHTWRKKYNVS